MTPSKASILQKERGTMSTTWIVIANASKARLFANSGPRKGLTLVQEMLHPESRDKSSDLVSDRPGKNASHGNGQGGYVPPTDPKQYEAERFAADICHTLESGRTVNSFERLIVVASPTFLGLLNSRMSPQVRQKVSETIEKDYTHSTEKELVGQLEHCIYL
jgi:protein required for attachment to host cells